MSDPPSMAGRCAFGPWFSGESPAGDLGSALARSYAAGVAVLFVVLTVLVVAAIGLVSVGGVTKRLEDQPPPSFFDSDEALEFIASHLSDEVTAQLSYDDVRLVMGWHIDYLENKGVAAETEDELIEEQAGGSGPMVAEDDEGLAYVLGKVSDAGLDIDDLQVVAVVDQFMAYLDAIGAIGGVVEGPVDPR